MWKGQQFVTTDDTRSALARLKERETYSSLAYCTPKMVSDVLRSDEHLAYLPLLDFIPPFHEMLDHVEHTGANEGHMRLIAPLLTQVYTS